MESGTILQGAGYIAIGIAAWPICKYVFGPVLAGTHIANTAKSITKDALEMYKANYSKVMGQRGKVAIELGKAGKNGKEISDILEASLPLPTEPEINL